jgi:hypothetical protein
MGKEARAAAPDRARVSLPGQQLLVRRLGDVARHVDCLTTALGAAQSDAAVRIPPGLGEPALGNALDRAVPAGWASEPFAIPVGENELESFGGPVFLDASTSHSWNSRLVTSVVI